MSAPPLPDAFGNYALGDFVEVTPADPISWLPQTSGWYCLGAALLFFGLYYAWKHLRQWYGNRYRREAIARLRTLDNHQPLAVTELNRTLKLVAMAAYSRETVAQLTGVHWTEFLESHCDRVVFSAQQLEILAVANYQSTPVDSATTSGLINAAQCWVNEHQVAHA